VDLQQFYERFRPCFKTRTHDTSACALRYWRGQLTMDAERNFANLERRLEPGRDGQQLQQFMSDSPWPGQAVFAAIQKEIAGTLSLRQGGVLVVDETADAKAGGHSVGAARQHNGRLGKVDLCQVATCLSFAHPASGLWTMVDGALFLPEPWFAPAQAGLRERLGVPPKRTFQTKPQLAVAMIERAAQQGLPFERIAADTAFGRNRAFRAAVSRWPYALQVTRGTLVFRSARTRTGLPVWRLARSARTRWRRVEVRWAERGRLVAEFAVERVWVPKNRTQREPLWLVLRREAGGELTFTLLNDPSATPEEALIQASCQRYFTECVFEEAKSELGWDDFRAQKYRAWEHEIALTGAALWFIAELKLKWKRDYERDPQLKRAFAVQVLPALSTANVRELLQAMLPLPQLSQRQATALVVRHLINRARSTGSRLKKQLENSG
jgi:SRSO17 transposase